MNDSYQDQNAQSALKLENVSKSYGSFQALNSISFTIPVATCYGLLGPNGAGKTSLMNILYGRAMPDSRGDSFISLLGHDPRKEALNIKFICGIVPQENNLDQELTVIQNLEIYSRFYAMNPKKARLRIAQLLDFMELQKKAKVRIRELSGGMRRRLIIARALLNSPSFLILDEPTTGLDPQVRHLIWDKLRELKKQGVSILLSTHYMEEAFQLCDNLLIMDRGKKILEGQPHKLLQEHMENYVLEIYGGVEEGLDFNGDKFRQEKHANVHLYYSNDFSLLKKNADNLPAASSYLRQVNLEDLFLKTTGRSLND